MAHHMLQDIRHFANTYLQKAQDRQQQGIRSEAAVEDNVQVPLVSNQSEPKSKQHSRYGTEKSTANKKAGSLPAKCAWIRMCRTHLEVRGHRSQGKVEYLGQKMFQHKQQRSQRRVLLKVVLQTDEMPGQESDVP